MAVRRNQREHFYVGFIGSGEVTEQNATELLDTNLLPTDNSVQIHAYIPASIKRTQKGLTIVRDALDDTFGIDYVEMQSEQAIVEQLIKARANAETQNYTIVLVACYDDSDSTYSLIEQAQGEGIQVKDLCAALDDILPPDDEPPAPAEEPAPKQRGKARGTTKPAVVEAKVVGPATVAPAGKGQAVLFPHAQVIEAAIRQIVREEIAMGLSIGHNTFTEVSETDRKVQDKVRAFVNEDGDYTLAPEDAKKAPRGSKTVELSAEAAAKIPGLLPDADDE